MKLSTTITASILAATASAQSIDSIQTDKVEVDSSITISRDQIVLPIYQQTAGNVYTYGEAEEQIIYMPVIRNKKRKCPACGRG